MSTRGDILSLAKRGGWTVETTRGGHLRLSHPRAAGIVTASATPSDHRALAAVRADMRRALGRTPKPPPQEPRERERERERPKPTSPRAEPLVGLAREQGSNRIVGQAGGVHVELRLDDRDGGRCWRLFVVQTGT